MNIILVCSSLEPGRDGVGDYVRLLAAAFIHEGHQCALVSLNDKFISDTLYDTQLVNDTEIAVLRIPRSTIQTKLIEVKQWVDAFNPDWLSMQYVMFGYHHKGLPFGLSKQLSAIGAGRQWHVMFHELWVGMATEESAKLKLWGYLQKRIVKMLISRLEPKVIHTQTYLYKQHLEKMGHKAIYLPIFSNIPFTGPIVNLNTDSSIIRLIVFGLIHTGALIEALAIDAAGYSQKNNVPVVLTFIGWCGSEQEKWAAKWKGTGLDVEIMGEQPVSVISEILQRGTFGISSTAVAVAEKSGSFAAMREHKLPVLNISKPWQPHGMPRQQTPSGMMIYRSGSFAKCMDERDKLITEANNASAIANKMLADLLRNA